MPQLKTWQHRLFYLLLFLIPANLAKHFPISSSYISGILVDYLIPTLYLTDILIITLLVLWLIDILKSPQQLTLPLTKHFKLPHPLIVFFILLLPSIFLASKTTPVVYKLIKYLEFILLALWIKSQQLKTDKIIAILTASTLFQSLLALTQWFKQSSVASFWFLGEQPYNQATFNIDKIIWFNGALKIPPLATFPHPNILAGFLALTLPLILYQLLKAKSRSYFPIITLITGTMALFLTFSLSAWLAFLLIGLPAVLLLHFSPKFIRPVKFIFIYLGIFLISFSFASKFSFLAPQSSFTRRSQLGKIALQMIQYRPLTGIGLNNFTITMEQYGFVTATTRFLQPVHNVYLLVLAETGFIGFLGLVFLIFKALTKPKQNIFLIPLLSLLFIGLFDHYPLTIQQGSLLFFTFLAFLI